MSGRPGAPDPIRSTDVYEQRRDEHVAVKLRLMRMGKKKQPTSRWAAAAARPPRAGGFIEPVAATNPRLEPSGVIVDNEKALKWLRQGAQPSETVQRLLVISGAWDEFKGTTPA